MGKVRDISKTDVEEPSSREKLQLSGWILGWFYATAIICTWDATFIMLRPHTLPGGSLAWLWYAYKYYVEVDQRYQDTDDAFVFAQSLLNYAEVALNIVAIVMHYRSSRHTTITAFMVSVMTMWKTILYFLMFSEFCTGGVYRQGNTGLQEFFLVYIPNVVWVIAPLAVMYALWGQFTPHSHGMTLAPINCQGHVNGKGTVGNGLTVGVGVDGEKVNIRDNNNVSDKIWWNDACTNGNGHACHENSDTDGLSARKVK